MVCSILVFHVRDMLDCLRVVVDVFEVVVDGYR